MRPRTFQLTEYTGTYGGLQLEAGKDSRDALAWHYFDTVGEQRQLAVTMAKQCANTRLVVLREDDAGEWVQDDELLGLLEPLGDSPDAVSQSIYRMALMLYVSGQSWLALVPESNFKHSDWIPGTYVDATTVGRKVLVVLPASAVKSLDSATNRLLTLDTGKIISGSAHVLPVARLWRPGAYGTLADSPVLSCLDILAQLEKLTQRAAWLAAGFTRALGLPTGFESEVAANAGQKKNVGAYVSQLVKKLQGASMCKPGEFPVFTADPETIAGIRMIDYTTPLDTNLGDQIDQALRRLANSQGAPPEMLLGIPTQGSRYGYAEMLKQDSLAARVSEQMPLICDALTRLLCPPGIRISYDTAHLGQRTQLLKELVPLYDRNLLTGVTLVEAAGYTEIDMPDYEVPDEVSHGTDSDDE